MVRSAERKTTCSRRVSVATKARLWPICTGRFTGIGKLVFYDRVIEEGERELESSIGRVQEMLCHFVVTSLTTGNEYGIYLALRLVFEREGIMCYPSSSVVLPFLCEEQQKPVITAASTTTCDYPSERMRA